MKQLTAGDYMSQFLFKKFHRIASIPGRLIKSAKTLLLGAGLLTAGMVTANAGAITGQLFYLENNTGPYVLSTTALPTGDGFKGLSITTPLTWTTAAGVSDTVPVGYWNVTLYSNSPGAASVVQVDILQNGVSLGHISTDVNASGAGNHTTNFAIPVTSAITFSSQTLGVKVTQVSGAAVKIAADGDFPSTLSWSTTSGGTGGGGDGDGTAGPSTDGGKTPVPTTTTMTFNNTSAYPNSQVYVMIIGLDPNNTTGGMSWFNAATGKLQVMQLSDNNGIGSTPPYTPPAAWGLPTKTYAPYSFTLDQHPSITLPWITSSRIFYSYGYPTYMNVVSTPNGVYAAEPANPIPTDPNWFMPWDAIEINFGSAGLNIDTTRVDFFNIPSNYVITSSTGATAQRGDLAGLSHDQYVAAFQSYISSVGGTTVFGPCVVGNPGGKIVNSGFAAIQAGGIGDTYFDAYINSVWAQYPAGGSAFFNLPIQGGPYSGQVNSSGQMVFTKAGDTTDKFYINRKPTTIEIISCAGAFNDPTNSTSTTQSQQLAIQAATAATFNRAIAADPSLSIDWTHPGAFYQSAPANYYSAFWHIHGYAGLAYGFPYDDEASQSSDCNYIQPTNVTLNMWYNPIPPAITSTLTASGVTGTAFNYQITGSNNPTSFNATGLPGGLTVNTTTGAITGTPTTAGSSNVTISAINGGGTGTATLVISIAPGAPVITSSGTATGTIGTAFTYNTVASPTPTSYAETGTLPAGLTFSTSTGAITGTPTAAGSTTVSITATNAGGTSAPLSLTITINATASTPSMISLGTATGTVSSAFTYVSSATNVPTSYAETGTLPAGLTFSTTTGAITGTPTAAGTSTISITATNGTGTSSALSVAITVYASGVAPTITSATTATAAVGSVFSYQTTGSDTPTSYALTGTLPAGLTFSTTTGAITGTPTTAGSSSVALTATNSHGTSTAITLAITVNATTTDTNVGLNEPASASSVQAGNSIASANDGNTSTRWAAESDAVPQYWEVNLGASKTLSRVDINWYTNATRYSQYTILTSTNGTTWTTRVNKSSNVTDGLTSDTFSSPVTAQYVIVNVSKVSSGFVSAYEIGVYGH
jgi:hypothetical protein